MDMIPNTHIRTGRRMSALGLSLAIIVLAGPALGGEGEEKEKFHLELFGGADFLRASDLNLMRRADTTIQYVLTDEYFFQYGQEYAQTERTGGLRPLRHMFQGGLRAAWAFCPGWSLTFGVEALGAVQDSSVSVAWNLFYPQTQYFRSTVHDYPEYRIGASAFSVLLGLRRTIVSSEEMKIQGYLGAGFSRMRCRLEKEWRNYQEEGYTTAVLAFDQSGRFEMKGSGWGIAADAGMRIDWNLFRRGALFLETGYAFRRSGKITGDMKETIGSVETTAAGTWKVVREELRPSWDSAGIEYPTLTPEKAFATSPVRDFRLDLSGFSFRAGLSFIL